MPLTALILLISGVVAWLPVPNAAAAGETVSADVTSGADDARTPDSGGFVASEARMLVGAGNGTAPNVAGYRFAALAIPRGAIIDSVAFSLVKQGTQWQQFRVDLAFEASDSVAPFSAASGPAARPRTTKAATIDDNVQRADGVRYTLGDQAALAGALKEVVNRPGWKAGNSVGVIAYGPATPAWARLGFYTVDAGASLAPRLIVNYHLPAGSTPGTTTTTTRSTTTASSQTTTTTTRTTTSTSTGAPPPAGVGACGESQATWHPPVINGCATGHEHGDAPPDWVHASGWHPMFDHPGNTPNENVLKHTAFKGFTMRDDGIDLYVIMHLDTNPSGHASRFHSYQVWARDETGAVSHWDLWADFGVGDMTGPQSRPNDRCGGDNVRPIMLINYADCATINFETWYSRVAAPAWGWDMGYSVSANYYGGASPQQPSNPDPAAHATWLPTGGNNGTRRVEMAWYGSRPHPTGRFYSTQWGEIVSGPTDPRCGTPRTFGAKSYTTLCIEQHIAPSMTTFAFPDNAVQKTYPMTGVKLPN